MAVRERPSDHSQGRRAHDPALDEVLNTRKSVYIYQDEHVIKETELPDLEEHSITELGTGDGYVSREDVDRNTQRMINRHLDEKFNQAVIHEQKVRSRKITGRRIFETIVVLLLVVFVSALVILLMYPQTQLAEMARDNSNAKDRIARLKTEILDAEEAANGISDMDRIRAQALALGMQDPNQNQVISLPVPNNDTLKTVVSYDAYGVSEEALNSAMTNLADYYRNNPSGSN